MNKTENPNICIVIYRLRLAFYIRNFIYASKVAFICEDYLAEENMS